MPVQVADRGTEFESAGVDLLLLQSSPQIEEMERYAEELIPHKRKPPQKQRDQGRNALSRGTLLTSAFEQLMP